MGYTEKWISKKTAKSAVFLLANSCYLRVSGSSGWYRYPLQADAAPLNAISVSSPAMRENNLLFMFKNLLQIY
jgi:hypothetical protein